MKLHLPLGFRKALYRVFMTMLTGAAALAATTGVAQAAGGITNAGTGYYNAINFDRDADYVHNSGSFQFVATNGYTATVRDVYLDMPSATSPGNCWSDIGAQASGRFEILAEEDESTIMGGQLRALSSGTFYVAGSLSVIGNVYTLDGAAAPTVKRSTVLVRTGGNMAVDKNMILSDSDVEISGAGSLLSAQNLSLTNGHMAQWGGGALSVSGDLTATNFDLSLKGTTTVANTLLLDGCTLSLDTNLSSISAGNLATGENVSVINVAGIAELADGSYTLANYASQSVDLTKLSLAVSGCPEGFVDYSLTLGDNALTLEVKSVEGVLTWNADAGTWATADAGTPWVTAGSPTSFANGDKVIFSGGDVTLAGEVAPAAILVKGSAATTFSGEGSIVGATSLLKLGDGTLTINNANAYTGGTTIEAGVVDVQNADALGSGAITVNGGTLQGVDLALTQDLTLNAGTVSNNLSGDVAVLKNGSGEATLSGSNTHTGGTRVTGGSLTITRADALGSGAVAVDSGSLVAAGAQSLSLKNLTLINGGKLEASDSAVTIGEFSMGDKTSLVAGAGSSLSTAGELVVGAGATLTVGADSSLNTQALVLGTESVVNIAGATLNDGRGDAFTSTFEYVELASSAALTVGNGFSNIVEGTWQLGKQAALTAGTDAIIDADALHLLSKANITTGDRAVITAQQIIIDHDYAGAITTGANSAISATDELTLGTSTKVTMGADSTLTAGAMSLEASSSVNVGTASTVKADSLSMGSKASLTIDSGEYLQVGELTLHSDATLRSNSDAIELTDVRVTVQGVQEDKYSYIIQEDTFTAKGTTSIEVLAGATLDGAYYSRPTITLADSSTLTLHLGGVVDAKSMVISSSAATPIVLTATQEQLVACDWSNPWQAVLLTGGNMDFSGTGLKSRESDKLYTLGGAFEDCRVSVTVNNSGISVSLASHVLNWDGGTGNQEWKLGGDLIWNNAGDQFKHGDTVIVNSTSTSGDLQVAINGLVMPESVTVSGEHDVYFTQSDAEGAQTAEISGASAALTVSLADSATLTIDTVNSYGGGTTINSGTVAIVDSSALGTGDVTLLGGKLEVAGGSIAVASATNASITTADAALTAADAIVVTTGTENSTLCATSGNIRVEGEVKGGNTLTTADSISTSAVQGEGNSLNAGKSITVGAVSGSGHMFVAGGAGKNRMARAAEVPTQGSITAGDVTGNAHTFRATETITVASLDGTNHSLQGSNIVVTGAANGTGLSFTAEECVGISNNSNLVDSTIIAETITFTSSTLSGASFISRVENSATSTLNLNQSTLVLDDTRVSLADNSLKVTMLAVDVVNGGFTLDISQVESLVTEGGSMDPIRVIFENTTRFNEADTLTIRMSDKDIAAEYEGGNVFSFSVSPGAAVPEPTTATLSLLALAGLAARRRRS